MCFLFLLFCSAVLGGRGDPTQRGDNLKAGDQPSRLPCCCREAVPTRTATRLLFGGRLGQWRRAACNVPIVDGPKVYSSTQSLYRLPFLRCDGPATGSCRRTFCVFDRDSDNRRLDKELPVVCLSAVGCNLQQWFLGTSQFMLLSHLGQRRQHSTSRGASGSLVQKSNICWSCKAAT